MALFSTPTPTHYHGVNNNNNNMILISNNNFIRLNIMKLKNNKKKKKSSSSCAAAAAAVVKSSNNNKKKASAAAALESSMRVLEWDKVCDSVASFAGTSLGTQQAKAELLRLDNQSYEESVRLLAETNAAVDMHNHHSSLIMDFSSIRITLVQSCIQTARRGFPLHGSEAIALASLITLADSLQINLKQHSDCLSRFMPISQMIMDISVNRPLLNFIHNLIHQDGSVKDSAYFNWKMFRAKTTMHQLKQNQTLESAPLNVPLQFQPRYPSSIQFQSHFPSITQFQPHHPSFTQFQPHYPSSTQPELHNSSSTHTPIRPHFLSTIRQNSSSSSSSSYANSQSLQYQPRTNDPKLHQSSSLSIMDHDQDESEEYEMNLLHEAEIIGEHGHIVRTQKMTAKDVFKLNEGEKIMVRVNEFYQPIKGGGGLCTRFMTLLLKEPHLCPPEAKNWKELKMRCGVRLLIELRRRFNLPQSECVDKVLFKIFAEKFRTRKSTLKKSLYELAARKLTEANNIGEDAHDGDYTEDELLEALDLVEAPKNFVDHQWESYKSHLRSPTTRKLSQYGKKARAHLIHNHTNGAVSLARKKDEFKLKHKREPYQAEFFEICYKTKKGSYVRAATRELMDHAKKEIAEKMLEANTNSELTPEKCSEIEREVMNKLLGPEKPGRARFYGAGVTKSQVDKFSCDLRRLRGESLTNENHFLSDKVGSQSKKIEAQSKQIETQSRKIEAQSKQIETQSKQIEIQSKQIETQSKQIEIMEGRLNECTGEIRLFMTAFQDSYSTRTQRPSGTTREGFYKYHEKDLVGAASRAASSGDIAENIAGYHGPN